MGGFSMYLHTSLGISTPGPPWQEHLAALTAALHQLPGDGAARAQELRQLAAGDGCVAQLWPKLRLVVTVTGGNFEAAAERRGEMVQMISDDMIHMAGRRSPMFKGSLEEQSCV